MSYLSAIAYAFTAKQRFDPSCKERVKRVSIEFNCKTRRVNRGPDGRQHLDSTATPKELVWTSTSLDSVVVLKV